MEIIILLIVMCSCAALWRIIELTYRVAYLEDKLDIAIVRIIDLEDKVESRRTDRLENEWKEDGIEVEQ